MTKTTEQSYQERVVALVGPMIESYDHLPARADTHYAKDKQAWMVAEGLRQMRDHCRTPDHLDKAIGLLDWISDSEARRLLKGTEFGCHDWIKESVAKATAERARVQLVAILRELRDQLSD